MVIIDNKISESSLIAEFERAQAVTGRVEYDPDTMICVPMLMERFGWRSGKAGREMLRYAEEQGLERVDAYYIRADGVRRNITAYRRKSG